MQEAQEIQVRSLCRKDPPKKQMTTHLTTLAWKSHGQRSLAGHSPWSHESWTWLSGETSTTTGQGSRPGLAGSPARPQSLGQNSVLIWGHLGKNLLVSSQSLATSNGLRATRRRVSSFCCQPKAVLSSLLAGPVHMASYNTAIFFFFPEPVKEKVS